MFKMINKNDNTVLNISFQPTLRNLIAYGYTEEFLEVPLELYNKDIEVKEGIVVEKPLDIEKLKKYAVSYLQYNIEENKKNTFVEALSTADGKGISISLNLLDSTVSTWNNAKLKPFKTINLEGGCTIQAKFVPVINSETNNNDYILLSNFEFDRILNLISEKIEKLEITFVTISNKINKASDELVKEIYEMSVKDRQEYINNLLLECNF